MRQCILLLSFLLLSLSAAAQVFKGRITDVKGNPVPYAALYLKELSAGFTSDDNGCFQTTLKKGNYTCDVSSIGFVGQTFQLQMPTVGLEKNIVLAERVYELLEVNVTKGREDPAYAVMRQAIAHAPYYRTQVKSYRAGTYLKGTSKINEIPAILKLSKEVRKESKDLVGKLFVLEDQREVWFTAPATWDSQVKAYSNSFPESIEVDLDLTTINFYTPLLFGKVSPLSPGAFSFYHFRLDGCYVEGEHVVNKIKLLPKKEIPKLLSGYIYIIDNLWCLSAADLSFTGGGLTGTIKATCKEVKPSAFLPTSISMGCKIDIMGMKAEASYLSAIHYVNVELNQQRQAVAKQMDKLSSDEELTTREAYRLAKRVSRSLAAADTLRPKHKFERIPERGSVKKDSLADKKDSLYWATVRSVPLRPEELESYRRKELQSLSKDSLKKRNNALDGKNGVAIDSDESLFSTLLLGNTFQTKNKQAWLQLYGLKNYLPAYNFVDGLWVGAKFSVGVKLSPTSSLYLTPMAYYTTARKSVVGSGELTLDYAPRHLGKLRLSGGVLTTDYNGESGESHWINGMASLFFARNDVKLYDKRFLSVDHQIEWTNGLLFSTGLTWQRRKMLNNHVFHSMFGTDAKSNVPYSSAFRPMPTNELLKASFALEYTPAHYYRMSGGKKIYEESRFPTFTLGYERAFPMTGSTLAPSYHRAEFSARQQISFGLFNVLSWSVNGGSYWGAEQMQFPDYKHFAATRFPWTERLFDSGFFLLDNYAYSTDARWAQAGLTWRTPYLLLKQLPFLQKKLFTEALHLRTLVVYGRKPYTEVGYSIGFANRARVGLFLGFEQLKYRSVGVSVSLPFSF